MQTEHPEHPETPEEWRGAFTEWKGTGWVRNMLLMILALAALWYGGRAAAERGLFDTPALREARIEKLRQRRALDYLASSHYWRLYDSTAVSAHRDSARMYEARLEAADAAILRLMR